MDIKRRDFLKLVGLIGFGKLIPFNIQEANPYNQWKPLAPSRLEKKETVCPFCYSHCTLELLKKRENIFSIFNKEKKGLCPKIFSYHNIIYNEDRIKTPLLRKGERGTLNFIPVDYENSIKILKERFSKGKFHTLANTNGEVDRYFLSAISTKINFYPDFYLKSIVGAERVYFDIEKADLVLNFGGDILNYGYFIDFANILSQNASKVISFSPMVTKGTALGEKWYPISIIDIPILIKNIQSALNKKQLDISDLENKFAFGEEEFIDIITKINNSRKVCVSFDPKMLETKEGINAVKSIINLANSLKSLNKEGGTFFFDTPTPSKPFNILKENIYTLFIYNFDPLLTTYSPEFIEKLKNTPFIVFMGHHHSEISKYADLILPVSYFVEKDEIYLKKEKNYFTLLRATPSVEGGVEAVELRKKENIEVIFQKLLNFKAPYGIKDISEISNELDNKLPTRNGYITSSIKSIKIKYSTPQLSKEELLENSNSVCVYLYEDGILDFTNRGSKWAEESSNFNRALINKNFAHKLGVKNGDYIEIKTEKHQIKLKCFIFEGIADNIIALKKYKIPVDINKYTNKKTKSKTKDKEVEYIWWQDEDTLINTLFNGEDENIPVYSVKILSVKKV